jgi:hypothetical protein
MRSAKQMWTGLGLTTVALIMVLALTSTGAQATGGGRIASTCSNETVNGGRYVEDINLRGELTLRFVLIGSVTCAEAHRLVRAYFGKMAADQQCGTLNSFCDLQFAGGWDCFIGPPAQQQDGAIAGCLRTGAKIRLYRATAAPPTRSLNGPIVIAATCAAPLSAPGSLCAGQIGSKARDYTPEFGVTVGSHHPDHDSAILNLMKKMGSGYQSHGWGVNLLPGQVRISRSKVSIEVKHPIGPGAADGEIDFTFSGGPVHTRSTQPPCGEQFHVTYGTITGTIQIKVRDRFFKTITITRMRAQASDSPVVGPCNPSPPCSPSYTSLAGTAPSVAHKPEVGITATKPLSSGLSPLAVDVTEPHIGTPFTVIDADMVLGGTKTFLSLGPNLTSAKLSTPGGVISGGLSVQASGGTTTFPEACKVGHDQITIQPAHRTTGKVTATFDSIGKVFVGTNLNNSSLSLDSTVRVP